MRPKHFIRTGSTLFAAAVVCFLGYCTFSSLGASHSPCNPHSNNIDAQLNLNYLGDITPKDDAKLFAAFWYNGGRGKAFPLDKILTTKTAVDINDDFPSSWLDRLDEVVLTNLSNQVSFKGDSETLNHAQRRMLRKLQLGDKLLMEVKYGLLNDVSETWEDREIKNEFVVMPKKSANFPGGGEAFSAFFQDLNKKKVNQVFIDLEFNFDISETGKVLNARLVKGIANPDFVNEILSRINAMPNWEPATLSDGRVVVQPMRIVYGVDQC